MAEKVRSRASKWDVAAEAHVETEIKHDNALPAKVDDSCIELAEPNHEDHDGSQILRCHEAEPCLPMNVAAEHHVETEIKHDNALTATLDSCIELPELNHDSHDCSQILRRYEAGPMNVDGSEIDRSDYQSGQVENNNVTHSDDFCENAQKSKQFEVEADCKDGFKKQDWELPSQDQTMTEYSQYKDKPLKGGNAMSPGPDERRQWNHNISPTDGWSRSDRKRSRSGSLSYDSRSKSPSYASKQGCESWVDKGSMRPAATACRNFAAGWCRLGSECRYLHEGGGRRRIDSHHDSGSTDERESRFERGRNQGYDSRESLTDSRQKVNYLREKNPRRIEDHFDDERDNNEQHRGYRSNEMCFDFTRGRCYRGASCRYIHHDTSSDGRQNVRDELRGRVHDTSSDGRQNVRDELRGRVHDTSSDGRQNVRDELRGRVHDRRDEKISFGRRLELRRVTSVPCKYFLEGHCHHGEYCKFFHQVGPLGNSEDRSHDDSSHHYARTGDRASGNASELHDQAAHFGPTISLPMGSDTKPVGDKEFTSRSLCERNPTVTQDAHSETQPSGEQATTRNVHQEFPAKVNTEGAHEGKEVDFANNILPIASTASQNFQRSGHSQIAAQPIHAHKVASNTPFPQIASQLPLNGQMQPVIQQSGQNLFTSPHKPSDAHYFNSSMQNYSTHHPEPNPQKFDYGRHVQQSLHMQSHVGNQQNHNVNGQIQQNLPIPHNAQSQPNFNVSSQNQQNIPSEVGNSQENIIVAGDTQHILPQNAQSQQLSVSVPSLVSNGQIHLVPPKPHSNPQNFSSDEKSCQLTSENNLNALQQPKQIVVGKSLQGADLSEVKPSVFNSDNLITHKLVTSEQAAKITGLSASLAQFFGSAALNSQTTTGLLPPADLNPGSLVTVVAPLSTAVEGSKTNLNHLAPSALTVLEEKPLQKIHLVEQIREGGDASSKEAENFEKPQKSKELPAQLQHGDQEVHQDWDGKKSKEAKVFRMFKCALVELVKDMLKPTWKEGQLSKEAHNTIVKKVADKVTGSLQGPNVPQTQEKIDLYLSSSKAKLSKLVQAYVEKFVRR